MNIIQGEEVILTVLTNDPFATVTWSTDEGVICNDCRDATVSPNETTVYYVTVTNEYGCSVTEEVVVSINNGCEFSTLEIPNIISPNGDGSNDRFEIRYSGLSEISVLRIYNRWGDVIFETNDVSNQWDGTYRGDPVNPGVYVYYLEARCLDNELYTVTGNITVLK